MRAAEDPAFQRDLLRMRDTRVDVPVSERTIENLQEVSAADIAADPGWAFAPIAVLSNMERHKLNDIQLASFAEVHGLPLVKWRLPLTSRSMACCGQEAVEDLYANEVSLWGYFVRGAPAMRLDNINPTKLLANGS